MTFPELSLHESHTFTGSWWHPSKPNKRVPGELTYTPGKGLRLSTNGALMEFFDVLPELAGRPVPEFTIRGRTRDGMVSLLGCGLRRARLGRESSMTVAVQCAVLVYRVESVEHALFRSTRLGIPLLDDWLSFIPLRTRIERRGEQTQQTNADRRPVSESGFASARLEATVAFRPRHDMHALSRASRVKRLEDGLLLEVFTSTARSADWLYKRVFELTNFLTLCVGQPLYLNHLSLEAHRTGATRTEPKPIRVLFRQAANPGREVEVQAGSMLAPFVDIRDGLVECIDNWFELTSTLGPALDAFL